MIQLSEQLTKHAEHPSLPWAKDIKWDDLALFVVLARTASLRAAAREIKVAVNTVRDHLQKLEDAAGTTLFRRQRNGIALSADGERLLSVALEMQSVRNAFVSSAGNNITTNQGEIRIACSEGIGEFWLTPRLPELQERLGPLTISVQNEFDQDRIHDEKNDVRISFKSSTRLADISCRIATLHFLVYASESYLDRFGMPQSVNDAAGHRLVIHEAPGLFSNAPELFLGQMAAAQLMAVKVNTSYALYRAIAGGIGIGALPTYVRAVTGKVRPLDLPIQTKFDLWLSYHEDLRHSAPIRETVNWLRSIFDPALYPWFREEFIHPDDFEATMAAVTQAPQNQFDARCLAA